MVNIYLLMFIETLLESPVSKMILNEPFFSHKLFLHLCFITLRRILAEAT